MELLDGGNTRTATVKAIEGGRSVSIDSLLNGDAFRVSNDGVWRDGSGLVRVFPNVVLVVDLLRHRGMVVLVGGVIGNSDRRLLRL